MATMMISPVADIREMLTEAKRQRAPFDLAWKQVVALLRCEDRDSWIEALRGTTWAWRNVYEGVPARREEIALEAWWPIFAGREIPALERRCGYCDEPIGPERDAQAVYCTDRCRSRAWREQSRRVADAQTAADEGATDCRLGVAEAGSVTTATERAAA